MKRGLSKRRGMDRRTQKETDSEHRKENSLCVCVCVGEEDCEDPQIHVPLCLSTTSATRTTSLLHPSPFSSFCMHHLPISPTPPSSFIPSTCPSSIPLHSTRLPFLFIPSFLVYIFHLPSTTLCKRNTHNPIFPSLNNNERFLQHQVSTPCIQHGTHNPRHKHPHTHLTYPHT